MSGEEAQDLSRGEKKIADGLTKKRLDDERRAAFQHADTLKRENRKRARASRVGADGVLPRRRKKRRTNADKDTAKRRRKERARLRVGADGVLPRRGVGKARGGQDLRIEYVII